MTGPSGQSSCGITISIPFGTHADWLTTARPVRLTRSHSEQLVKALTAEVERRAPDLKGCAFKTVYFAGCGPSLLGLEALYRVLQVVCDRLTVEPEEQTLTVVPGSVDEGKAKVLRESGFDRVALRFEPGAGRDFRVLRDAGFRSVGIEFAYGAGDTWRKLFDAAMALEPDHVTLFVPRDGSVSPVDLLQSLRVTREALTPGCGNYALHQFSRPGRESRHILLALGDGTVVGLGPGAVGRERGRIRHNLSDWDEYLDRAGSNRLGTETPRSPALDAMLRLEGAEPGLLTESSARSLVGAGLVARRSGRLFLTDQGVVALDRVRAGLAGS